MGFLKKQLVAGNPVTWFIMWSGQTYPIYDLELPHGVYGHVEPVIGIQSNHPLSDETVYDDDVLVHFDDNSKNTIYKPFKTLSGDWSGPGHRVRVNLVPGTVLGLMLMAGRFRAFSMSVKVCH